MTIAKSIMGAVLFVSLAVLAGCQTSTATTQPAYMSANGGKMIGSPEITLFMQLYNANIGDTATATGGGPH